MNFLKVILLIFFNSHLLSAQSFIITQDQNPSNQSPYNELAEDDLYSIEEPNVKTPQSISPLFLNLDVTQNIIIQTKIYINLLKWHLSNEKTSQVKEKYNRKLHFGRWINDPNDSTCFNTRAQVLIRDSMSQVEYRDTNKCIVNSGKWIDPYTKKTLELASDIDIDHLVPLKNAYETGAWKWSFRARCLYANYTGYEKHLLSVSKFENRSKGDSSPYEYIPPEKSTVCEYIKDWLTVKSIWNLKLTTLELQGVDEAIYQHACDKESFKIKNSDRIEQHKFITESIDLCDKITSQPKQLISN